MKKVFTLAATLWVFGYISETTIRLLCAWDWISEEQMRVILTLPTD
ncbi:hypothetical protein PJK55_00575 [Exiguobacterium sp. MMG028]|nr:MULTISPECIES: hypothetical protein [Exiguobacterium]MDA5559210.1 hypothetical protein [Exiguobacterium sp. MMG028]